MLKSHEIIQQLAESEIYRDYEQAFHNATHLPLTLRPHEIWHHALHGKTNENPFCSLLSERNKSCAACLQAQQQVAEQSLNESATLPCFAGLVDTTVPIKVGVEVIGFLQTGQVALQQPSRSQFNKVAKQLVEWGVNVDLNRLEDAYFHSKVLGKAEYEAMVRLLEIFARHLSICANQIMVQKSHVEPPMIKRAKEYIRQHQEEPLSLQAVADALHVSTFYFCKMFKKATGLTFTDYLTRTRIEKAKNLLLNPHVRVSEAAYDSGFTSLTHFNRSFKRVTGLSPTDYRRKLKRH